MFKMKHDEFGVTKFIMALMVSICHYYSLVENPIDIIRNSNLNNGGIKDVLVVVMALGVRFGGSFPICFFVLSGFLFYKNYAYKISIGKLSFREFVMRRIMRLYPLLFLSVLTYTIGQWIYYYHWGEWWSGRESSLWNFLISLSGISVGTFINAIDTVNGPIWYISVLMVVYVMAYYMFFFYSKMTKIGPLVLGSPIILGLAIRYYNINLPFLSYYCAIGYMGFFIGVMIAMTRLDEKKPFIMVSFGLIFFILIIFVIFQNTAPEILGSSDLFLGFIVMPVWITVVRATNSVWRNSFFDFLSKLSFPFYLFHIPTFLWMEGVFAIVGSEFRRLLITYVVVIIVSVVLTLVAGIGKIKVIKKKIIEKIFKSDRPLLFNYVLNNEYGKR